MALWFRAPFYHSHHCLLTYLQWGVKDTLFFPMNSSFCRLKAPVFLTISLVKFLFRVGFSRPKCHSFVLKHADLSASGAIATYECTWVCPCTYFLKLLGMQRSTCAQTLSMVAVSTIRTCKLSGAMVDKVKQCSAFFCKTGIAGSTTCTKQAFVASASFG